MLEAMRRNATSPFIKVVFIIIVIVFVFWGVGSYRAGNQGRVAMVNGETITTAEFTRLQRNLENLYREQAGGSLDARTLEQLNLPAKALDQLINYELLVQQARAAGLEVTDKELVEYIGSQRAFIVNGTFDKTRYRAALAHEGYSPETYEESQRRQLLFQKMRSLVTGAVPVTGDEVKDWYQWVNREIQVSYAAVSPSAYTDVTATEDQLKEWYDTHSEEYRTRTALKVRYAMFEPAAFKDQAVVTQGEAEDYYNEHYEEFEKEKKVHARHILFRLPENPTPEQVAEARARAVEVEQKARAGEDFAELAKQFSEGPSASRGGDLGSFGRNEMVEPFAKAAFAMEPGEVSGPVQTQFGWHIIKVEDVTEAHTLTLEEARPQIEQALRAQKADNEAFSKALELYEQTLNLRDLAAAARATGAILVETDWFTRNEPPKNVVGGAKFAETAFDLTVGEFSDVTEMPGGFYVMQVTDRKPPEIPPFEQVRAEVKTDVLASLRDQRAEEAAGEVLTAMAEGASLTEAAAQHGLAVKTTGFFKRTSSMPELGYDPDLFEALFSLTEANPVPDTPISAGTRFYVARLDASRPAPEDGLAAERQQIVENLRMMKQPKAFSSWLEAVRSTAEIKIYKDVMKSAR